MEILIEAGVNSAKLKYLGKRSKLNPDIILTQGIFDYLSERIGKETPKYMEAACYFFLNQSADKNYRWTMDKVHITNAIYTAIKAFDKIKNKTSVKDITSFKTLEDLQKFVNENEGVKSKSEIDSQKKLEGATLTYNKNKVLIYEILSKEASCFYGSGTKWCITMKEADYYEDYVREGKKFFFLINNNRDSSDNLYKLALVFYPNFGEVEDFVNKFEVYDVKDTGYHANYGIGKIAESTGWDTDYIISVLTPLASTALMTRDSYFAQMMEKKDENIAEFKSYWQEAYTGYLAYAQDYQIEQVLRGAFSDAYVYNSDWTYEIDKEIPAGNYLGRSELNSIIRFGLDIGDSFEYPTDDKLLDAFEEGFGLPRDFLSWNFKDSFGEIFYRACEEIATSRFRENAKNRAYTSESLDVVYMHEGGYILGTEKKLDNLSQVITVDTPRNNVLEKNYEDILEILADKYLGDSDEDMGLSFDPHNVAQILSEDLNIYDDMFYFTDSWKKAFEEVYQEIKDDYYKVTPQDVFEWYMENQFNEEKFKKDYEEWKS